jgi:hypothetical protein
MSPPVPERRRGLLAAGLLLGAGLRLAALPLPGTSDVPLFKGWAQAAATRGMTQVYGTDLRWQQQRVKPVNYPPLSLGLVAAVGHAYGVLEPSFADGTAFTVLIKLPVIAADAALAALLFGAVRRARGERAGAAAALAYWLNPAVLIAGAVLGYQDSVMALPGLAALVAAAAGRPILCGALAAVAVLFKPQAVLLGPSLLLALGRHPRGAARAFLRAAAAGLLAAALVLAPFAVAGTTGRMVRAVAQLATHDMFSADAANVWWLVGWAKRGASRWSEDGLAAWTAPVRILRISTSEAQGLPNPRPLGTALVLAAAAWAGWRARQARELGLLAALGAFVVHAYFTLAVGVHENHLFLAVPLLTLAASLRPAFRGILLAVSALTALNLNFIYGFGLGVGGALPRGITGVDATVVLALANLGVFFWHARVLAREVR